MTICGHVLISGVHDALSIAFNVEHASTQNVTSIICSDFEVVLDDLGLIQLNGTYLLDARLDHI